MTMALFRCLRNIGRRLFGANCSKNSTAVCVVICGLDTRQPASNTYINSLNGFSEDGGSYDMKLPILDAYCVMNHCDASLKVDSMANFDCHFGEAKWFLLILLCSFVFCQRFILVRVTVDDWV